MLICETCKYYEMYPKFPNPNYSVHHYCHKCKDEIRYKNGFTFQPARCYYNDYYEPTEEEIERKETRYRDGYLAYQVD